MGFDMGVWGPYSARRGRHFALTTHHRNANGDYVTKEIPGPQSLEDWLEGWTFATTGFTMGKVVERGVAEAYRNHFATMARTYPKSWWICAQAEWECRFEWAPDELRRQRQFHEQNPTLSQFNPAMPWNSVLLAAVRGVEALQFWEAALKEKARQWEVSPRASTHPSWVERQAQLYAAGPGCGAGAAGSGLNSKPQQVQNPPGTGKRAMKRARQETARQDGGRNVMPRIAENAGHPRKANDGKRYLTTYDGKELCFAWNRNAEGCCRAGPCGGNPPRHHGCELCLGAHRAIHCPSNPGWQPPPRKGAGKGQK